MKTPNDVPTWPSYTIIVNILFKASIFPVIGKKNNQSPVSDAGQEIPTLRSMDNAGNSVNRVQASYLKMGDIFFRGHNVCFH